MSELQDLSIFVAVARAGGFRGAAQAGNVAASSVSSAVRRLEARLGVRLFNRTTRSVTLTEAGTRLFERLAPALKEVDASLDVVNAYRDRPTGTLTLNVAESAARLTLPDILPGFLRAYPDIRVRVVVDTALVDVLANGADAGIRYEEQLAQDMIAVPIGARVERFATAASPAYLAERGVPAHPSDLLAHACICGLSSTGRVLPWMFERAGEVLTLQVQGPLVVQIGSASDLTVRAAVEGLGIVTLFEDWLAPHLANGDLVPVLEPWWQSFSGPFLYYAGRRHLPAPLRAFVEFIRS